MIESVLLIPENIDKIVEETKYTRAELVKMIREDDVTNVIRVICYITKANWEKIGKKLPEVSEQMGISQTAFLNKMHYEIEELARVRTQALTETARIGQEMMDLAKRLEK